MDEIIFSEMSQYDVTCHTDECENSEYTIRLSAAKNNPYVICGACSQIIQDVVEV